MKNKKNNLKISEVFMAKAGGDFSRCFHGTILRGQDSECNPVVYGKIKVYDGYIYAKASDQWELGEKLDEMVLLILDNGLHSEPGKTPVIAGTPYFLN